MQFLQPVVVYTASVKNLRFDVRNIKPVNNTHTCSDAIIFVSTLAVTLLLSTLVGESLYGFADFKQKKKLCGLISFLIIMITVSDILLKSIWTSISAWTEC